MEIDTPGKNRQYKLPFIPHLDALRFFGFVLIFIHHIPLLNVPVLDAIRDFGWIGVDIFLTLSAYLLTTILMNEITAFGKINFRYFLVRRILRIWPLYLAYCLFAIGYASISSSSEIPLRAAGLLTFTDNLITAIDGYNPIRFTGHLWTICYEEQFYLVLPVFLSTLWKQREKIKIFYFFVVVIAGVSIKTLFIIMETPHPAIWVLPFTHFESITAGIVIALYEKRVTQFNSLFLNLILFLSILLLVWLPSTDITSYHLLLLYPVVAMISGVVLIFSISQRKSFLNYIFNIKVFQYLGKISFGLYVFHSVTITAIFGIFQSNNVIIGIVISFLATIGIAVLSYHLYERHFLKMKKQFTRIETRYS